MKILTGMNRISLLLFISVFFISACNNSNENFLKENIKFAEEQTRLMLQNTGDPTGKNYPRTMNDQGELVVTNMYDWTPGFFPGSLWYLYELTGDNFWREKAAEWTHSLEPLQTFTQHHDLGFMMYCSYGNALRLDPQPEYKDILVRSAESLSTRFDERTQVIKSWNSYQSWDGNYQGSYPVIVDNMMNLEMLFAASRLSGNPKFYDIAVRHANTTIKSHFRDDYGTYHVVDFDTISGQPAFRGTAQGYSDNSTWSRGQAWIIYGFTMMYRETKDPVYLDIAQKAADYYIANLPEDKIPVWDLNVDQKGFTPGKNSHATNYKEKHRDASAGAITCSALFELGELIKDKKYTDLAIEMLHSLASPQYRAELGENGNFLIMHCVGSIPHKFEIDKPLTYADYYFLEALTRYRKLK